MKADIVSFHIPYNEGNHYLVNKYYLSKFHKPIFLINTSRGRILQTADLLSFIQDEKIKGACLDVLENENFESYTHSEKKQLEQLVLSGKVILTPHIAGKTAESEEKIYNYLLTKIKTYIEI